jgi:uncharacterized protein
MQPAELRRRKDQAAYDVKSLTAVFSDSFISNVAFVYDGHPACLPMVALVRDDGNRAAVYLHGYPSSRLIELC